MGGGRKTTPRKPKTAFELTPLEQKVLDMHRSGMSPAEISRTMGWKSQARNVLAVALEKDALRLLKTSEAKTPRKFTSLARARKKLSSGLGF